MKPTEVAIAACEVVLAVADDQGDELVRILRKITTSGVPATALIVQLSQTVGELMRLNSGDDWRDVLTYAMLDIDAESGGGEPDAG